MRFGEFRRSAWFGILGVLVVAAITVVIALSADPADANPKLQYGLIFGVVGAFIFTLLFLQRRDLGAAESADARFAGAGPSEVADPTKVSAANLWAALAVKPIDSEAARARGEMWGAARRSMNLAAIVCILIFLTVPPIYLLDTFVTLYVGVPLIVIVALYGSIRAVGSGGEIDQGFERIDRAIAPLGLHMVERPELRFEPRMPPLWGANARLRGPLVIEGKRHGNEVAVTQEDRVSVTAVGASVPSFEAKARDGRIRASADAPQSVVEALDLVPGSAGWKGVKVRGGRGGIEVERKGNPGAWLCDLWLAERLAGRF